MTTMPIDNHPFTQRRLQFIGISVNKLTFKSINIIQSSNNCNIVCSFICLSHTINCAYYAGELRRLRGKKTRVVLLLQDNVPAHTSQVAMAAANECGLDIFPHPPYSHDLAPSGFYLSPKLNSHLFKFSFPGSPTYKGPRTF